MSDENSTNTALVAKLSALAKLTKQTNPEILVQQFMEVTDDIYKQLLIFSEQSIFAPPEQITQFRAPFLDLLYQLDFDPLFGGLVLTHDSLQSEFDYEKPLLINCLIADLLLQTDRLLYTGELNQTSKSIAHYLQEQLETCENSLIKHQFRHSKQQCPNVFQREQLETLLDDQEQLLLNALISESVSTVERFALDNDTFTQENGTCTQNNCTAVFYKRSLIDAANLINMPFKQAQIVEHALQLKLATTHYHKQERIDCVARIKNNTHIVLTNSLILRTLSNVAFYIEQPPERPSWQSTADRLMKGLIKLLDKKSLSVIDKIQISVAAIYYLQTEFNLSILCKLIYHLEGVDFDTYVSQQDCSSEEKLAVQQLNLLANVISTLSQSVHVEIVASNLATSLAPYLNEQWTLIILQKQAVQLDSQLVQIKSEFNPYRLVYCV